MKLSFKAKILGAAALLGLVSSAAFALTSPPSFPARVGQNQTVNTFRKTVNFNDANIGAGVKIGALPAGAFIVGMTCQVTVAFNAGTTNVLTIGSTATGTDFLAGGTTANTNCNPASATLQPLQAAAGMGVAVTAPANTPTGSTGAWDLFVRYTQTGTAATTGSVTYVIQYVPNNDQ